MTVWVVIQGEYSDRKIVGVYSSEKAAKVKGLLLSKKGEAVCIDEWDVHSDNDISSSLGDSIGYVFCRRFGNPRVLMTKQDFEDTYGDDLSYLWLPDDNAIKAHKIFCDRDAKAKTEKEGI